MTANHVPVVVLFSIFAENSDRTFQYIYIYIYIYGRQSCSMRWSPSFQDILTRSLYSLIAGCLNSARSSKRCIQDYVFYHVHTCLAKSRYPTVADLTRFCTGVFQGLVSRGKTLVYVVLTVLGHRARFDIYQSESKAIGIMSSSNEHNM